MNPLENDFVKVQKRIKDVLGVDAPMGLHMVKLLNNMLDAVERDFIRKDQANDGFFSELPPTEVKPGAVGK